MIKETHIRIFVFDFQILLIRVFFVLTCGGISRRSGSPHRTLLHHFFHCSCIYFHLYLFFQVSVFVIFHDFVSHYYNKPAILSAKSSTRFHEMHHHHFHTWHLSPSFPLVAFHLAPFRQQYHYPVERSLLKE